jgi:hypothetical protein
MGETLLLILLFVIMAVMGLANSNYDKDKDDYMSGEDGNDHYEGNVTQQLQLSFQLFF